MTEYRKFKLSPGQQAPDGNTGISLDGDWIVWAGEEGTFNEFAKFGKLTAQDQTPSSRIENEIMTQEEIDQYNEIIGA